MKRNLPIIKWDQWGRHTYSEDGKSEEVSNTFHLNIGNMIPNMKKNTFWIKKEMFQIENSETYLL